MLRQKMNYWFGTISAGLAAGDVTINSAALANVPAINNPTNNASIMPVALQDQTTGNFEVMWITNHALNATSATVSRGKEGTLAQSWVPGSLIGHAPLALDLRQVMTAASIAAQASNYSIGDEVVDSDFSVIHEMTNQGFRSRVYTDATGLTPGHGAATPQSAVPILKAFTTTYTPNSQGNGQIAWPGAAFPNGVISVQATVNSDIVTAMSVRLIHGTANVSGVQLQARTISGGIPTDTVPIDVIVIGY